MSFTPAKTKKPVRNNEVSVKQGSTAYSRLSFTFHRSQGNLVAVAVCLALNRLPSVVYIPNVVTHNTTVVVAVS